MSSAGMASASRRSRAQLIQPLSSNVFRMLGAVGLDKMDVSYNRLHLPNQAGDTLKKIG